MVLKFSLLNIRFHLKRKRHQMLYGRKPQQPLGELQLRADTRKRRIFHSIHQPNAARAPFYLTSANGQL